jgi:LDH2 family malate/lactate/ureidoglycolate dehydrogenase
VSESAAAEMHPDPDKAILVPQQIDVMVSGAELCGLLTGLGFGVEPTGRHNDGCFMAVFNVAAFRPLEDFKKEVAEFARYLKSTPPSEGSHGVFYPGEIEYLREQERRKIGIEIEDATWDKLRSLAAEYKIAGELGLA